MESLVKDAPDEKLDDENRPRDALDETVGDAAVAVGALLTEGFRLPTDEEVRPLFELPPPPPPPQPPLFEPLPWPLAPPPDCM